MLQDFNHFNNIRNMYTCHRISTYNLPLKLWEFSVSSISSCVYCNLCILPVHGYMNMSFYITSFTLLTLKSGISGLVLCIQALKTIIAVTDLSQRRHTCNLTSRGHMTAHTYTSHSYSNNKINIEYKCILTLDPGN